MKEKKKEAFELSWACIAIRYCTCASVPPQYCYCDGDGSPRAISHCDPAIRYSDCDNGTTTEDEYCLLFRGCVSKTPVHVSRVQPQCRGIVVGRNKAEHEPLETHKRSAMATAAATTSNRLTTGSAQLTTKW